MADLNENGESVDNNENERTLVDKKTSARHFKIPSTDVCRWILTIILPPGTPSVTGFLHDTGPTSSGTPRAGGYTQWGKLFRPAARLEVFKCRP